MPQDYMCYSRGNILAKLMIVGQAPGKEEATRQWEDPKCHRSVRIPIPFCGVAGILLMSVLKSIGIQEGDYIMTNTVKFYPTTVDGNLRAPTLEEIEESRPRLIDEILVIRPKLIIALGVEAMWCLVHHGQRPLSTIRSTHNHGFLGPVTYRRYSEDKPDEHTCNVLQMFHPSYLRRMQVSQDREYTQTMTLFLNAFSDHREAIEEAIGRPLLIAQ